MAKSNPKNEPFGMIPRSLFDYPGWLKLNGRAQALLVVLICHRNSKDGTAWPTMETLASLLGISRRRVVDLVKDLRDGGLIQTKHKRVGVDTRLIYTFPTLGQRAKNGNSTCKASADDGTSVKGNIESEPSELSSKSSEVTGQSEVQKTSHISEDKSDELSDKYIKQQQQASEVGEVEVSDPDFSEQEKILREAGFTAKVAKKYAHCKSAKYIRELISYCKKNAKTRDWKAMVISALQEADEWDLCSGIEWRMRYKRCQEVFLKANENDRWLLTSEYKDADGLFGNLPILADRLLNRKIQDVIAEIIAAILDKSRAELIARSQSNSQRTKLETER